MESLVSTDWLKRNLEHEDLAVLDASLHLHAAKRDPRSEWEDAHIPGARFLDLTSFTNPSSDTPSALPNPAQVSERLAELGLSPEMRFVIYDDSAVKTAARAWFALRSAGVTEVAILDGGLAKWRAEGLPLESGTSQVAATSVAELAALSRTVSKTEMIANLEAKQRQIIDARGADRVFGTGVDPVHGGQNGRIPGSLNVPFNSLYEEDGTFRPAGEIRGIFENAGVDLGRPVTTSCGSGVTACVLLFALELIGHEDGKLYDGSWQEWEADPATPKAQGPA